MAKIFVVDDEKNIRELVVKYLEKDHYDVVAFENAFQVETELQKQQPDLIVLDINMPGMDGLELCKNIRKHSEVPIIFISARDEAFDRILGLELGGDDYLSKPFSPRELVVRIKTVLKRYMKRDDPQTLISIGNITIDEQKRLVQCENQTLNLTIKEYELFEFLARNPRTAFSREQLIESVWGYDYIGETRVIDDLVKRLRKKIKQVPATCRLETVWGYGYKIETS